MKIEKLTVAGCLVATVVLVVSGCTSDNQGAMQTTSVYETAESEVVTPTPSAPSVSRSSSSVLASVEFPNGGSQSPHNIRRNAGTIYIGCPNTLSEATNKGLSVVLFDPKAGKRADIDYIMSGSGLQLNAAGCALTGTSDNLRLVVVANTTKPADGLQGQEDKTTAYIYDIKSTGRPAVTKDLPPMKTGVQIYGTSVGVVLADSAGTKVFSNSDLSELWSDSDQAVYATDNAVVLPRYKNPPPRNSGDGDGIEVKSATGESIYRNANSGFVNLSNPNRSANGEDELISGNQQLLVFNRAIKVGEKDQIVTDVFDVNARKMVDPALFPTQLTNAPHLAFSEGRLFAWDNGGEGAALRVSNLETGEIEFSRTADQVAALHLEAAWFFGNHLYFVQVPESDSADPNLLSVYALPNEDPIARTWANRPIMKIDGWTLVLKAVQKGTNGAAEWNLEDCRTGFNTITCDSMLVKDVNGKYPGPWV